MAARAMLLILAVGLFMAIWSGDHNRPKPESADPPVAARKPWDECAITNRPSPPDESADDGESSFGIFAWWGEIRQPPDTVRASDSHESAVEDSDWVAAHGPFPLPGRIATGDYRVVCSDGQVWHLNLSESDLQERGIPGDTAPRPSYEVSIGRLRWYFIRVTLPGNSEPPALVKDAAPVAAPKPQAFEEQKPASSSTNWVARMGTAIGDMQMEFLRSSVRVRNSFRRWIGELDIRGLFGRKPTRISERPDPAREAATPR